MEESWRNLEQRVAQYFERNGYSARTNQKLTGTSGLVHEVDVVAERRDAAGVHRVAVECKAWRSRVGKEVVYKLKEVMRDAGLTKGIVVAAGGLATGARTAAEQANIEVWGPDEIRYHLGDEALAGLPLALADESLGLPITVGGVAAEREIKKARAGFAGIGGEDIVSVDLVWVPAYELHLAVTRLRPTMIREREEVVHRWNLYEALAGRLVGHRDDPRPFVTVSLQGPVLRPQRVVPQVVAEMRRTIGKHRNAKTDAAQKTRQDVYNAIGLPGSTREFAVEAEKQVFLPYYVGLLRRKASERMIAIHGNVGIRSPTVEQALHEKIDLLRRALDDRRSTGAGPGETAPVRLVLDDAQTHRAPAEQDEGAPLCACGAVMVLRHRKSDGAAFWGCSTYPRCRQTRPQ